MEVNKEPKRLRPYFDVSKRGDYKEIECCRKYQYIILDLGAVKPEKLLEINADLPIDVLPNFHRIERASLWLNYSNKLMYVAGVDITIDEWKDRQTYSQSRTDEERLPPINIKFKDRKKYYDSFTNYHRENGDPSMLTEMITKHIEEELGRYISALEIENNIDG